MEHVLSNKVALVTGGGHGIGAAIARQLATMGATTVICGRNRSRLQQTAKEISCESLVCDVSDWDSVASLAQRVQQTFNHLDILVNNAGIGGFGAPFIPCHWKTGTPFSISICAVSSIRCARLLLS